MAVRELQPLRVLSNPILKEGPDARASTEIYRPFFLAGILSVLTAGCALGAIALYGIAVNASYTASAWTPYILAHANSQLYGWVGFFVMGFALQQHAPTNAKAALFHRLAMWSLGLMAGGIVLRFLAEPLVRVDPSIWLPVGVLSCVAQAVAVGLFFTNTCVTRYRSGEPLSWQTRFVFMSLFWWLTVAIVEPFFFVATHSSEPLRSIQFVAEYFPAYREAQFLGFVANMIFGVSLVKLSSCFGFKQACPYFGNFAFIAFNAGLVIRMAGWVHYFRSGLASSEYLMFYLGGVLMALGALAYVVSSQAFHATDKFLPSHKFIRAALAWLLVSGLLMGLEPIHLMAIGQPFSHAFTGAIRHAATVGFISQMIMGVSLVVVARMNDLDPAQRSPLWAAFLLLNFGNAGRVILEVATDYSRAAFAPMGFTGFIELVALSLWAYTISGPMLASLKARRMAVVA